MWSSKPGAIVDVIDEVWNVLLTDTIDEGTIVSQQVSSTDSLSDVAESAIGPNALPESMISEQEKPSQEITPSKEGKSSKSRKQRSSNKTASLASVTSKQDTPSQEIPPRKERKPSKSKKQKRSRAFSLASVISRQETRSHELPSKESESLDPRKDASSKKASLPSKDSKSSQSIQLGSSKKENITVEEKEELQVPLINHPAVMKQEESKAEIPRTIVVVSEEPIKLKKRFMAEDYGMIRKSMEHLLSIKEEDSILSSRKDKALRDRGLPRAKVEKCWNPWSSRQKDRLGEYRQNELCQEEIHQGANQKRNGTRPSRAIPQQAVVSNDAYVKKTSGREDYTPRGSRYSSSTIESRDPDPSSFRAHQEVNETRKSTRPSRVMPPEMPPRDDLRRNRMSDQRNSISRESRYNKRTIKSRDPNPLSSRRRQGSHSSRRSTPAGRGNHTSDDIVSRCESKRSISTKSFLGLRR